jgi:hypothetical protein
MTLLLVLVLLVVVDLAALKFGADSRRPFGDPTRSI